MSQPSSAPQGYRLRRSVSIYATGFIVSQAQMTAISLATCDADFLRHPYSRSSGASPTTTTNSYPSNTATSRGPISLLCPSSLSTRPRRVTSSTSGCARGRAKGEMHYGTRRLGSMVAWRWRSVRCLRCDILRMAPVRDGFASPGLLCPADPGVCSGGLSGGTTRGCCH